MSSFLQSKEWEEFQISFGRKTFRVDQKLMIKFTLPLNKSYLYSPRPYFKDEEELNLFLKESAKIAQKENSIFLRLEPDLIENFDIENSLEIRNWKLEISKCIQPQDTLIMDLGHTEETLLQNMHPKTRYNIRLAERHGIKIKKSTDVKDIDIFYNLALKTSERDKFSYHTKKYYQKMLEVLGKNKMVELFISYHKNIPTSAILVMFYKNTAIYMHGASDHEYRNLMSPYLIQWEAIKEAKNRGCKSYDFWGISPVGQIPNSKIQDTNKSNLEIGNWKLEIDPSHPWAGITRFKKGFAPNGSVIHYPDCYDVIYNQILYNLYKLGKNIKKIT